MYCQLWQLPFVFTCCQVFMFHLPSTITKQTSYISQDICTHILYVMANYVRWYWKSQAFIGSCLAWSRLSYLWVQMAPFFGLTVILEHEPDSIIVLCESWTWSLSQNWKIFAPFRLMYKVSLLQLVLLFLCWSRYSWEFGGWSGTILGLFWFHWCQWISIGLQLHQTECCTEVFQ